ncbi:hypothetical protein [Pseudomonas sp. Sample_10]|uniref:hypothetical protein n=1 Tax=Pseudomonas sp. Sample_10 TaxID=2448269 RepID=UPI0010360A1A|nr:hypothetical protein [Pseudomonas sp. Sample_10]
MNTLPLETIVSSSAAAPAAGSNPAFLSCDDAAAFMHESLKGRRSTEFTGFILKNTEGRFYCALEVKSADELADTELPRDFPLTVAVNLLGEMEVPSGYSLEASLVSRVDKAKGFDESAVEWNQRNLFHSVADLHAVMSSRRQYSRCYLSASDGGLIAYTSSLSDFEKELSPRLQLKPDGRPQNFEGLYERGAIPSSVLILLAVAAGEVTTVVAGSLWRRRGRLKASWRNDILQHNPPIELMPVCGPVLKDVSAVAHYLHEQMLKLSHLQQHVGIILKHKTQDVFVVTAPVASDYASFDRHTIFPKGPQANVLLPSQFRIHGFYHTMNAIADDRLPEQEVQLYKNFFSANDLRIGLSRFIDAPHHRIFLCTPSGAVLRFSKPEPEKLQNLMAQLDPQNADYQDFEQKILSGEMRVQAFVDRLAAAGTLSVLYPGDVWAKGRVQAPTAIVIIGGESAQ